MGKKNYIPNYWEREWEWKNHFRERESEAGIPGNGPEREFPLTPDPEVQKEGGSSTSQRPSAQGS